MGAALEETTLLVIDCSWPGPFLGTGIRDQLKNDIDQSVHENTPVPLTHVYECSKDSLVAEMSSWAVTSHPPGGKAPSISVNSSAQSCLTLQIQAPICSCA
jgi:hypothetical protein